MTADTATYTDVADQSTSGGKEYSQGTANQTSVVPPYTIDSACGLSIPEGGLSSLSVLAMRTSASTRLAHLFSIAPMRFASHQHTPMLCNSQRYKATVTDAANNDNSQTTGVGTASLPQKRAMMPVPEISGTMPRSLKLTSSVPRRCSYSSCRALLPIGDPVTCGHL